MTSSLDHVTPDQIKVVCEMDGFIETAFVSSTDQLDSKRKQLRELIERKAAKAFDL